MDGYTLTGQMKGNKLHKWNGKENCYKRTTYNHEDRAKQIRLHSHIKIHRD